LGDGFAAFVPRDNMIDMEGGARVRGGGDTAGGATEMISGEDGITKSGIDGAGGFVVWACR